MNRAPLVPHLTVITTYMHLHCTRNYIHLNLFTSFILRAVSIFIKDSMLTWMYKTAPRQQQWESESLSCRLIFVMMQYCVTANYYWLLVEGMYLYTLLALSVFSEQRIFRLYLCVGWGKCEMRKYCFLLQRNIRFWIHFVCFYSREEPFNKNMLRNNAEAFLNSPAPSVMMIICFTLNASITGSP
uniref:G-protein coupled receptors family 2 profile 2 domain-containing protein n=1 Tax=Naja naja TaxID=35670 RepID=A0A8C6YBB0_NAJNA